MELDLRLEGDSDFERIYAKAELVRAVNQEARHSTLLSFVLSFFFKGGNINLGGEFLHKSFREFLFVESTVAVLLDISEGQSGFLNIPNTQYWQDFDESFPQFLTSQRLASLLGPQWLTKDVRAHLFWRLEYEVHQDRQRWIWIRDLILDIYIWWAEGVHLRPQPIKQRGLRDWQGGG